MNDGKLCVSVCAETGAELLEKIALAAKVADIIELRFDYLDLREFDPLDFEEDSDQSKRCIRSRSRLLLEQISKLKISTPVIYTYRPKNEGGAQKLSFRRRRLFWKNIPRGVGADVEKDIAGEIQPGEFDPFIVSHHSFHSLPTDLDSLSASLSESKPNIIKFAALAKDCRETVEIFNFNQRPENGAQTVAIAMGDIGKWTRILGLAHGAPFTYGSLETGLETAAGQITVNELLEVYRVKEIDKETAIFGIIGHDVSHSLSPYIQNRAFQINGEHASYIPFTINSLPDFLKVMVDVKTRSVGFEIKGLSVTNPFKVEILGYLDIIDECARLIGAVNTVKVHAGELHGYNTDADGFIKPLLGAFGSLDDAEVAIIGAGGAARAAIYSLRKANASVTVFLRDVRKGESLAQDFGVSIRALDTKDSRDFNRFDILVNATPLGSKGEFENKSVVQVEQMRSVNFVYDLIYNPLKTFLMREADKAGIPNIGGLDMLIFQGIAQQEIWTSRLFPFDEMKKEAMLRLA